MNIKIKRLPNVPMPTRATQGSAGFDLAVYGDIYVLPYHESKATLVRTGLYIEIPKRYVGLLVERSSLHKLGLTLANSMGVIDSDYRGEILIAVRSTNKKSVMLEQGQRIAQLVITWAPIFNLVDADTLNETIRDAGGFGSSDN